MFTLKKILAYVSHLLDIYLEAMLENLSLLKG